MPGAPMQADTAALTAEATAEATEAETVATVATERQARGA